MRKQALSFARFSPSGFFYLLYFKVVTGVHSGLPENI